MDSIFNRLSKTWWVILEMGMNTHKEASTFQKLKVKKDQITMKKATFNDEASLSIIRNDRNNSINAKDRLINNVSDVN